MTETRSTWNDWDVPYFGGRLRAPQPPAAAPRPGPADASSVLPLADAGSRHLERVWAVLAAAGGIVGGFVVAGVLLVASFIFSFGSPPDRSDVLVAGLLGGFTAACGIVLAVLTWRQAGRPLHLKLERGRLEVAYKTFRTPFEVPIELVRVVAIDATPTVLFTNNKRFPIAGAVPPHAFADALDNMPAGPWDDLDPDRPGRAFPMTDVIDERMGTYAGSYAHDDPGNAGWASAGRPSFLPFASREAHLWSADGSSLPFLRVGPADVPNLAIIFREPLATPRTPWWFDLLPGNGCRVLFRGGRRVRGLLLRVRNAGAAEEAFAPTGLLRGVTAEDVIDEGLLVAKPLKGIRAVVYAVLIVGPALVQLVLRMLR